VKRTTIFLPEELHEQLRREAFEARVSLAELIRSRLQATPAKSVDFDLDTDPLLRVAGSASAGDLTSNLDEELYEL